MPGFSTRLAGIIESQEFIGFTPRGALPDYRLNIRGKSGKVLVAEMDRNDVRIETK